MSALDLQRPSQPSTGGFAVGLTLAPTEILQGIWHALTSMRTAVALMLALAVLTLIGTVVTQAPFGLADEPQARAAWLDAVRPRYGGWTGAMEALQLFAVFSSVWFRTIALGLTTSILACSLSRLRGLWRTAAHPRTKMAATFYASAPHRADLLATCAPAVALEALRHELGSRDYRIATERDAEGVHVYADRFRWAPFGSLMGHVSLILILVGALIGSAGGFRDAEFAVAVGSVRQVGHGTGLAVEARSFTDTYYESGSPSDFASDLTIYRDGAPVASQTVRVNQPLRYGDLTLYQSFFGAAAAMRVTDETGSVAFDAAVPLLWSSDDGRHRIGRLVLADAGLTAFVVGLGSGEVDPGIRAGQMRLEVYRTDGADAPLAIETLSQGRPATIAGLRFTFVREGRFTGLIVARDPGMPFALAGALLLVLSLFLVLFLPNRRIWARIRQTAQGSEIRLGAGSRHDAAFGSHFDRLVRDIPRALADPRSPLEGGRTR